jgi:hypothetical protein
MSMTGYNNTLGNGTPPLPPILSQEEEEEENNNKRRRPPHVYSDAVVSAPLITWFGLPTLIELEQLLLPEDNEQQQQIDESPKLQGRY